MKILKTINQYLGICLFVCGVAISSEDPDAGRPGEHICPITLERMRDPVVAADGYSYEREAITRHFRTRGLVSPRTNAPLPSDALIGNIALRTMIGEWRPGIAPRASAFDTLDAGTIAGRVRAEFEAHAHLLNASRGRDIVAFLGNTGAGKSTLVNLLAGKELVSPDGEDYVLSDPRDPTAMTIGNTGDSQTLYPKFIAMGDLLFFDLPGFNDTDGSARNLVNAAFIRNILMEARSVRAVFVAGQDEFTALRGEPVKQMFEGIRRLVALGIEDENLVKNGIFVVTKSTCPDLGAAVDFLLRRTAASTRSLLQDQLQVWAETNRLAHMHHPITKKSPEATRAQILDLIRGTRPLRVSGMNVSVLYPLEMKGSLVRMFANVMEGHFNHHLEDPLETLSEYDEKSAFYSSGDFWRGFGDSVCAEDPSVGLLKEFCIDPYNEAHRSFERGNEGRRQAHIRRLQEQRQGRVGRIEEETTARTLASIDSLVPRQSTGAPLPVDFAYHKDVYEIICGASLARAYGDPLEQEVVRRSYADFMADHIQNQMVAFMAPLAQRLAAVERGLLALSPPEAEAAAEGMGIPRGVPAIAVGYEAVFERFMRGVLVYKPTPGSDVGRVDVPIASLADPLAGTFDLSRFGDTGNYISIHTGYKKAKIAANANKVEIWVCPKFLAERELGGAAAQFGPIMDQWESPVAYFWTWGGWDVAADNYDYLVVPEFCNNNELSLYQKWQKSKFTRMRFYTARRLHSSAQVFL